MSAPGKNLDQFREAFDPTFELNVNVRYDRKLAKGTRCFIVTAAQNGTPVHEAWWATLKEIARHRKAELLVVPIRYKNPTSQWSGSADNAEWWDPVTRPYLWNVRHSLNPNLMVLGDFKIQPTASDPLTGAEALSLEQSGIIGHTKLHMRSIPTPANRMAKILTTTGACTVENYTDSRAGRIGEFHHSLSAVLVEVDGKRFHLRHLNFHPQDSSCIDLDTLYSPSGTSKAPRPLALVMGDTHVDSICPLVFEATFGKGGMIDALKPEHLVWHDLLDSYSCNPHHAGNPFNLVAKMKGNRASVKEEVDRAIEFVRTNTPQGVISVIVGSNHNDFLRRWIVRADWRSDPLNAEFYLETALAMVKGTSLTTKGTEYPDPFAYWMRKANIPNTRVLGEDELFSLHGIVLDMHGDRGPNGTRGSIRNLRRIGAKSIIGHSHSPGIDEGCYQLGTSTHLRLEYNHGASSWLNAHGLVHYNGKRQIVFIVDGEWRYTSWAQPKNK